MDIGQARDFDHLDDWYKARRPPRINVRKKLAMRRRR
jgi:hypothetical protein